MSVKRLYIKNITPRVSRHRKLLSWQRWSLLAGLSLLCTDALAIPSPDLVINLSASVAQLLGLLSVVFGGFVFSNKDKKKAKSKLQRTSRRLLYVILGLFVVSMSVNLLQYTRGIDAKNARLHINLVRKSVENGKEVGDTNIKTLSFSEQKTHPNGISTETLSEWLASGEPINLFDVREDEEIEGGSIDGATHIRYPDLLANPELIPKTGNNLLLCYSGNRSSELCNLLSKSGNSCNFMVGGYEKWLTEARPLGSSASAPQSQEELRNLPDFRNKATLLDTPDVHKLVQEENATFVDVRYPGEFSQGHLPGAINITMRALGSEDLRQRLNALPDVPLVTACYDKRSCFYSQLIGLRIDRMGKDYRGRYTVPHEFYQARGDREHVQQWKQANETVTLVTTITKPLASLLNWLKDTSGHYVLGILLLVLLVRLALLPLTLKSERDQAVTKALAPKIAKFREDYSSHPRALSKASLELYKEHKIKPVFNVIASLSQLSFLLLFYSVVNNAANSWQQSFLWLASPSVPDPYFVLPLVVTVLFAYIIGGQVKLTTNLRKGLFVLGAVAFFALLHALSAAVNVYFAFSMLFLVAQNLLIKALNKHYNWDGNYPVAQVIPEDDGIVELSQAHLVEATGKKAARLGILIEHGYNVPDGFVFTDVLTKQRKPATANGEPGAIQLNQPQLDKLEKLWSKLDAKYVAVRSSGVSEDGADTSFAGVYDSILNVKKKELMNATAKVHNSLSSDVASDYNNNVNEASQDSAELSEFGGVLIQKMVDAEYAGVMFTEHPANAGAMLVEVVAGLGEDLVSGTVTPDSYSFGKFSGQVLDDISCEIDLQPLLALGRKLEKLFDHPQDIEWAYGNGEFYLLQTRDITRSICDVDSPHGYAENERRKLLRLVERADADEPSLVQNELSELLPNPKPASSSFMRMLWSAGGSTDLACQQLEIPYDVTFKSNHFVTTVFGRTFINKVEERYRLAKGPGALAAFRLARNADAIEHRFTDEVKPELIKTSAMNKAIDYSRLPLEKMITTLESKVNHFVQDTYVEAELINIAADYYWKTATAKLADSNLDPATYLNHMPKTIVSECMAIINQPNAGKDEVKQFLEISGHRALYDYELSMPRYEEDPSHVINMMKGPTHAPVFNENPEMPEKKLLRVSVERVHRFQALKEEAKHYCLIELYEIRRLLLAIDQHCLMEGNVFQLSIEEILTLNTDLSLAQAKMIIDKRLAEAESWRAINPPTQLSIKDLERMDMTTGRVAKTVDANSDALSGNRVAGSGTVRGMVRVISSIEDIDQFVEGEILVARMTDPQWYPLFPMARGIITEVGGWLSHAAIVAREYNLPAIVGANNACSILQTGQVVSLTPEGEVVMITERRKAEAGLLEETEEISQSTAPAPVRIFNHAGNYKSSRSGLNGTRSLQDKRDRSAKQVLRNYVKALSAVPVGSSMSAEPPALKKAQ